MKIESGQLKLVHGDIRRSIFEYNGEDFSIQKFDIHQECSLGDHFHRNKSETFVLIEGAGFVLFKPLNSDGVSSDEVQRHELFPGSVFRLPPLTAHTFFLKAGSKMVCYSSAKFDSNNTDMPPFKIEL